MQQQQQSHDGCEGYKETNASTNLGKCARPQKALAALLPL